MGFAEEKFYDYLRKNLVLLQPIRVDELLVPLAACLSSPTLEKLNTYVRNQGNRKTVMDFYLDLSRSDNWVTHFIEALKYCEHKELAEKFDMVYSSYKLPNSSSPRSLPPSLNNYNQQPPQESPQPSSSLPRPRPPTSQAAQPSSLPESSQRFNQIQPEQEMTRRSPSQQNQEFRSLPLLPQDPPAPPIASLSHNVSAPIHSDTRSLEDSFRNPVPETTPHQTVPSQGDVEDESSNSRNPQIVPDLSPRDSLSPSLKEPQPKVSIRPSPEDVSLAKVPETHPPPSYRPSTSSEQGAANRRNQLEHDKTENLPEQDPAYKATYSVQKVHEGKGQQREPPVFDNEAHHPEQPVLASDAPSVRSKVVAGVQRNEQSANQVVDNVPDRSSASYRPVKRDTAQEEPKRERHSNQWVDNVTDKSPASYRPVTRDTSQVEPNRERLPNQQVENVPDRRKASYRPVNQETDQVEPNRERPSHQQVENVPDRRTASYRPVNQETDQVEPNRERPSHQQVPSGSSCRPYDNDFSKPQVLLSTAGCADVSDLTEESSLLSKNPEFQISLEGNESSNANGRAPPVSTPKSRNMQIEDRRSPEENDFMFDSRSSPGRNRGLDNPTSKQPEENSFKSRSVSHYKLQYDERPEEDLMESNDNALRNRPGKTLNASEPNDQTTQQKNTKRSDGRNHERTVLITVTVVSLCVSLYLLWKNRNN